MWFGCSKVWLKQEHKKIFGSSVVVRTRKKEDCGKIYKIKIRNIIFKK